MKVADFMTYRPSVIGEYDSVYQAALAMRDHVVGALPVVEHDRLVGIVTDRDLVTRAIARGERPWELPVREVMTRHPLICRPDEVLVPAVERMVEQGVRRLIVVDADKVVGILSLEDLALSDEMRPLAMRVLQRRPTSRGELDGLYRDSRL